MTSKANMRAPFRLNAEGRKLLEASRRHFELWAATDAAIAAAESGKTEAELKKIERHGYPARVTKLIYRRHASRHRMSDRARAVGERLHWRDHYTMEDITTLAIAALHSAEASSALGRAVTTLAGIRNKP